MPPPDAELQAMLKETEDALEGKDAEMQQLQVHMPWGDILCARAHAADAGADEGSRRGARAA